jgi:6-phospho-3-hexuloisomerase
MKNIHTIGTTIIQELKQTLSGIENEQAERLINAILESKKVFVAGAGRSGFMIKAFAMRLMHIGFETYVVGETITPKLTAEDVFIIASGSGATSSLVVMAQKAKAIGARIGLVTIDHQSPIAELADIFLIIPAPSPKIERDTGFRSVQPMGSLFEQSLLLTLDAMILMLMEKRGKTSNIMFTRHANLE